MFDQLNTFRQINDFNFKSGPGLRPSKSEAQIRAMLRQQVSAHLAYSTRGNREFAPAVMASIRAARRQHTESIARQHNGW